MIDPYSPCCTRCKGGVDNTKRLLQGKMFTGKQFGLTTYTIYLCDACAEKFKEEYVVYDTEGGRIQDGGID